MVLAGLLGVVLCAAAGCPSAEPDSNSGFDSAASTQLSTLPPEIPGGWPLPDLDFPAGAARYPIFSHSMMQGKLVYSFEEVIDGNQEWIVGFRSDLPWAEVVAFYDQYAAGKGMALRLNESKDDPNGRTGKARWEGGGYYLDLRYDYTIHGDKLIQGLSTAEFDGFTLALWQEAANEKREAGPGEA